MSPTPGLRASCACGSVLLETLGEPITAVVCYCDDCQAAGRAIEALGAQPVLDPDGGTSMVVYRKDRLRRAKGGELLKPFKLRPNSPTSRYVAGCCNCAMYLGFDDAKHWVDVFRGRIQGSPPPVEARICTRFRTAETAMPDNAPASSGAPLSLIAKIVGARIAMLFGP
jgi:hypothetical protein